MQANKQKICVSQNLWKYEQNLSCTQRGNDSLEYEKIFTEVGKDGRISHSCSGRQRERGIKRKTWMTWIGSSGSNKEPVLNGVRRI